MTSGLKRSDRRSRLRSATRLAHAHVDRHVTSQGFFDDQISYARYLQATWRVRLQLELALENWGVSTLFALWPNRALLADLERDFDDLGMTASFEMAPISTFAVNGSSQALGILYVLEGSALGARLLSKRAEAIGLTAQIGARHLARQTGTPGAWLTFLRILETTSLDDSQEAECIVAAVEVFDRFHCAYASVYPASSARHSHQDGSDDLGSGLITPV